MASRDRIKKFVARYVESQENIYSTQEILDSGCIPRLEGYTVHPGKVSDSIYGGFGQYTDKESGEIRLFENPPLETRDGVPLRIMVRTEKISTHDINRGEIPFKDQILAENHNFMRKLVADDIGTSQFDLAPRESPHYDNAVVIAAENLAQIPLENVLRGYMAKSSTSTSLYQHFMNGKRSFCGHELPDNLVPNGVLPYVMDTPSTKSERDESVSPQELFDTGVCTPQQYGQIRNASLVSFGRASQFLREKGLILVDTKTEHGINKEGEIVSQDELFTMDSSRFWRLDDYQQQQAFFERGNEDGLVTYLKETQPGIQEKDYIVDGRVIMCPKSFSKEFARGFSKGEEGYTDDQRVEIAVRYVEGIEELLGKKFVPDERQWYKRVITGIEAVLDTLVLQ